jgi:ribosome-binding factor A
MVRINEEVMRNLATLIRQVKDPRIANSMISVIRCDVTNDLRWCKVYVSVLGQFDQKEIMKGLKSASGFLRRELAHSMSLRYTPELVFVIDDSIAYGAHIAGILNKLDIRSEDEDESQGDSELN